MTIPDKQSRLVAVGMSGGTDSTAAAALLLDQGYRVMGVTGLMTREESKCCSDRNIRTARRVCGQLGIPHYVIDVHTDFEQEILAAFFDEYTAGRTPSPCVRCNTRIKFGVLWEQSRKRGATHLATGHYVRIAEQAGAAPRLRRGRDPAKDQSYFLARLSQAQRSTAMFPLGEYDKPAVIAMVKQRQLASHRSRESQDLCFVTEGDHAEWLNHYARQKDNGLTCPPPGDIVDMQGKKVGRHRGLHHYTVGQRRGIGVAAGYPVYAVGLRVQDNQLVIGPREAALRSSMQVAAIRWADAAAPGEASRCRVQVRYRHDAAPACVEVSADAQSARVCFDEPQFAITPGQLAAFYADDVVLGAGWIEETHEVTNPSSDNE